ncbi:hypothetical protein GW17_00047053 [Ensete ventricosum]|nr:hypothetical protein GW17_00047053 [Ensete ventricosum]
MRTNLFLVAAPKKSPCPCHGDGVGCEAQADPSLFSAVQETRSEPLLSLAASLPRDPVFPLPFFFFSRREARDDGDQIEKPRISSPSPVDASVVASPLPDLTGVPLNSGGMASAEVDSRVALLLVPALEKIVKNVSWRKGHSKLAHQCRSLIDRLSHPPSSPSPSSPNSSSSLPGPLRDGGAAVYSLADSETYLAPLIAACTSGSPRVAEPAIDCVQKLIAHSYLYGEADPSGGPDARLLAQLVEAVCGCYALGGTEDALELLVLKTLLSAVSSTALRIHGDSLLQIVRTCYDLYLGSKNPVNQATAKASLIQMLVIVFRRMEADSSTVPVQPIVVAELMEPADRSAAVAAADVNFVQGFITKIISDIDGVLNPSTPLARTASASKHDGAFVSTAVENTNPADLLDSTDKDMLDAKYWEISMYKTALEGRKDELGPEGRVDRDDDTEVQIGNKLKRDAFLVFRALCKLSMKTLPKEAVADPAHMKGKIVALELLKILLENAGAVFRTSRDWSVFPDDYVVILRFMIEVCWAPMLAAFSVPVDQSDDEPVISLCLEGFRSAVHVTAVMSMKTQRDAFVTSLAKFTSLHSAADIKQKNIDAIKVFATASYDDHKNIVLLAFEVIEKILRDYFPYITETETTTFTDCVNCLIAFTNSRFNKDISLNAIAFLRFCAAKLAEGDIGASARFKDKEASGNIGPPSPHIIKDEKQDPPLIINKDDHLHLWFPLLAGLSELTFDLRPDIRQSALQVLFDTLRNYGHHFSLPLWEKVFDSVLFPIFDSVRHAVDPSGETLQGQGLENDTAEVDQEAWLYETCKLALQLVVDLFVKFYDTVNPLLEKVLTLLTSFIKRPHQSLAGIGITAFVRLMSNAGSLFVETKWEVVVLSLKEAAKATLPDFSYISSGAYLDNATSENGNSSLGRDNGESRGSADDDFEGLRARNLYFAIGDAKCRAAVQLLLIQVSVFSSILF